MPSKGLSSPAAIPTPMGDRIPPGNKVLVRENNPPAPRLTRPRRGGVFGCAIHADTLCSPGE